MRVSQLFKKAATRHVKAAHHQEGGKWYVDTAFMNASNGYPDGNLRHLGMGEFSMKVPEGDIEFDRMRGKDFEGQSGRSHQLYGPQKAVDKLIKWMEQKNKSRKV